MADTIIRLYSGNKANMPRLADREPAYVRDEEALYVGTPAGNVKIGGETERKVKTLEETVNTHGETLTAHGQALATHSEQIQSLQKGQQTLDTLTQEITGMKEVQTAHGEKLTQLESGQQSMGQAVSALEENKLTAKKTASMSALAADADLAAVISAYNGLIAALKGSGVMNA